jgi:hypothetical protein
MYEGMCMMYKKKAISGSGGSYFSFISIGFGVWIAWVGPLVGIFSGWRRFRIHGVGDY